MNEETTTPYDACQQESIAFLSSHYHAACGDAPGLGKTRTAVEAAKRVGAKSALVVTLAGVRGNWLEHIEAGYGHTRGWDVISFNATIKKGNVAALRDRYDVVIIDEGHRCKDVESKWARAVFGRGGLAARSAGFIWPLSGTFMPNFRPIEMFPMLKALHPAFAQMSYSAYAQKYCGAYFDGRAIRADGASNTDELTEILKDFLIAHTKKQAYPGRLEPVISPVAVTLDQAALRAVLNAEREIISREAPISSAMERFSQLGDAATLRRLTGQAMVPAVVDFVEAKLESTAKIVLFFQHTDVGMGLAAELGRRHPYAYYAGGMSPEQQRAAIRVFQDPNCRLFIAQQQAAGSGINGLQGQTDTIVFAEPDWTPGETEQRVDRLDRMGSTADLITAYVLYARGTLGAAVWGVHARKEAVGRQAGWR